MAVGRVVDGGAVNGREWLPSEVEAIKLTKIVIYSQPMQPCTVHLP